MESSFSSREPDVLILFGALGGVMVGAVFYVVAVGVIRRLFWQRRSARPIERSERVFLQQQRLPKQSRLMSTRALAWPAGRLCQGVQGKGWLIVTRLDRLVRLCSTSSLRLPIGSVMQEVACRKVKKHEVDRAA
jgi:hypothetical protein